MSHKFTCALNKIGPYTRPHETVFVDLKESSISGELKAEFDALRDFAKVHFPEGPSKSWLDRNSTPSRAIQDYVFDRVFESLDKLGISAPIVNYRDGCSEVKRRNSSGSTLRAFRKAIFSYLLKKEAFFTLHAVQTVNLPIDMDEVDPEQEIESHEIEVDPPVCTNFSCAEKIRALEKENERLRKALVKSRKRFISFFSDKYFLKKNVSKPSNRNETSQAKEQARAASLQPPRKLRKLVDSSNSRVFAEDEASKTLSAEMALFIFAMTTKNFSSNR